MAIVALPRRSPRLKPKLGTRLNGSFPLRLRGGHLWLFNEVGGPAYDLLGGATGSLTTATWGVGDTGPALVTSGSGTNRMTATVGDVGNPSSTALSLVVRLKLHSNASSQGLLSLRRSTDDSAALSINIRSGGDFHAEGFGLNAAPNLTSGITPALGVWYTVVYTFDGSSSSKIYVNGVMTASNSTAPQSFTVGQIHVGGFGSDFDPSDGYFDFAMFLPGVLSASQVTQLYTQPFAFLGPKTRQYRLNIVAAVTKLFRVGALSGLGGGGAFFHDPVGGP